MNKKTFAGIGVQPGLMRRHYAFLYFNTLLVGIVLVMPAVLQPAFLKEIIGVPPEYFGSVNSFLSIISQIATLALAGVFGVLSDRVGRKPLAVLGFALTAAVFALYYHAGRIAALLNVPEVLSAQVCALLSFAPGSGADFQGFAPGLLTVYGIRLALGVGFVMALQQLVTMTADYSVEKDRGKAMAFNGVMIGLASGLVFGLAARAVKHYGIEPAFYLASALALVGMLATMLFTKDRMSQRAASTVRLRDIVVIVRQSPLLKTSYLCALITRADVVVASTFITTWGVMVSADHGFTSEQATARIALPMVLFTVVSLLAFPVVGILLDRWGRMPTIIVSLLLGGAGMLLLSMCGSPFSGTVYAAIVLAALGMPGAIAGSNALTADGAPPGMVGSFMGGMTTMQPIGIIFFLVVGGYLFDAFGPGWAFGIKGAATLALGLGLLVQSREFGGWAARSAASGES
jgi:MFS family permease